LGVGEIPGLSILGQPTQGKLVTLAFPYMSVECFIRDVQAAIWEAIELGPRRCPGKIPVCGCVVAEIRLGACRKRLMKNGPSHVRLMLFGPGAQVYGFKLCAR
jgi:hypothetical protein